MMPPGAGGQQQQQQQPGAAAPGQDAFPLPAQQGAPQMTAEEAYMQQYAQRQAAEQQQQQQVQYGAAQYGGDPQQQQMYHQQQQMQQMQYPGHQAHAHRSHSAPPEPHPQVNYLPDRSSDQQLKQLAHPIQPGPDERRASYAKSQRGRMTTGSIVANRAADEEMEDGRIRNREAATKIRDAWIYKQIRARQVRFFMTGMESLEGRMALMCFKHKATICALLGFLSESK